MALRMGTAADHIELWDELLDFLQNDTALVTAGQEWTVAWQHATLPELVLQGPGLSGTDEVLVGLKRVDGALTSGESAIWMSGCTGVIPTATDWTGHVNCLNRTPAIFLDHNPMQYWMVANGRRFVVVVKISTVYQAMYGGFFLPYSNPVSYPYPLFIGGTRGLGHGQTGYEQPTSWRDSETDRYRHFVYPRPGTYADASGCMLDPAGIWMDGSVDYDSLDFMMPRFKVGPRAFPRHLGPLATYDTQPNYGSWLTAEGRIGYNDFRSRIMAGLDGEMPLTPITLMKFNNSTNPAPVTFGILDGCFSVPGTGNVAENIITAAGVNHLVVPNVMRTNLDEYWALALE